METRIDPRIYVTAFNCSPGRGSDHASGWNHIKHISKYCKITVITDVSYRGDFENNEEVLKYPNISMEYVKNPLDLTFLNTLSYPWGFYLSYRFWEKAVYRYLQNQFKKGEVDLVHRLTLGAIKEPGYSWRIGTPYIWSQAHIPFKVNYRFFKLFSVSTKIVLLLLNLSRYIITANSRCRKAIKQSNVIFVTHSEGRRFLKKYFGAEAEICYEIGADTIEAQSPIKKRDVKDSFEIVWVGRIVDFKGIELLIKALAKLNGQIAYRLTIAGDGKDLQRMKKLSEELKVNVRFLGLISYQNVSELFRNSHCYVQVSFKDGLTNVVFESLTNNCPIICLNHLSYGEVVDKTVGIKIDTTSIDQIIQDLANQISFLYNNEDYRLKLISGIPEFLQKYSWDRNARRIIESYEKVLSINILKY
jgi:glycosyltransferase involved in cell wall biosynthesis